MNFISSLKIQRRILMFVGAVFAVIGLSAAGGALAATKAASGATCTIVGTAKNDVIKGTAGNDIICGLGGNDTITGLGGDDVIDGGAGNDTIDGGAGNDTLIGGAGNDKLVGGIGINTASFEDSSAAVSASLLTGKATGDGTDTIATATNLTGGAGNDTLTGSSAANTINGGAGNDSITGGAGNDSITGGAGNDTISGGAGNDTLTGGAGNDNMNGDVGDDSLQGGLGDDIVAGGDGTDTLNYSDNGSGVAINLATGVETGQGSDTVSGDENVISGSGNDSITGNDAANSINAGAGNDTISGGAGNDSLTGGTGNDVMSGGAGNDAIAGGAGTDTLDYASNSSGISLNLATGQATGDGSDTVSGDENVIAGSGNDTITGNSDANNIDAGAGNDIVNAGDGNDIVNAGDGNDTIAGGVGTDQLFGDSGNDRLVGDAGNDSLQGGPGNDGLVGGDGSDTLAGSVGEPAVTEKNLCEHDSHDTVSYCGFDEKAPWVESATLSKTEVDSSGSAQTVVVTMHVTDELMGVEYAGCSITLENARQSTGYDRAVRISGDAIDGIYTCNVTIPKGGSTGRWGLNFDTRDRAGNLGLAEQGANGKWHSNLPEIMAQTPEHWLNQVGVGDMLAPRITEPTFSATELDTSASEQTITIHMTVTDDYSGVSAVRCDASHNSAIDFNPGYGSDFHATMISGDNMSGVWSCTIKLPMGAGHGKWGVMISASDISAKGYSIETDFANEHTWIVGDLTLPYLPPAITSEGVNFFTQTGPGDDLAPVLQSISFDRTTINASSSDQSVTATLTVAPEQWGLARVIMFDVFSPQTMAEHQAPCTRTKVNSDGSTVWTCTFTIQLGSAKGLFPAMVWLADDAGNRGDYRGDPATGKWVSMLDDTGHYYPVYNLDLGPAGVTNTDQ